MAEPQKCGKQASSNPERIERFEMARELAKEGEKCRKIEMAGIACSESLTKW